jgi:hypothetical protein
VNAINSTQMLAGVLESTRAEQAEQQLLDALCRL